MTRISFSASKISNKTLLSTTAHLNLVASIGTSLSRLRDTDGSGIAMKSMRTDEDSPTATVRSSEIESVVMNLGMAATNRQIGNLLNYVQNSNTIFNYTTEI